MANTTTHSAPPNRAARPLPRIRPEVDIAPRLSLPLTQGHDATERSSTPLQTAYSPECLEVEFLRTSPQRSSGKFARLALTTLCQADPTKRSSGVFRVLEGG